MFCRVCSLSATIFPLFLLAVLDTGFAQTSINDVHITPRTITIAPNPGANAPAQTTGLNLIKSNVDLVTVPVIITDALNRPVTGLERENFQVFENKQPQEIRNFSSEDTPVSIGIILDTSGSMADKMERVREAVLQFCEGSNPEDEFFMITFSDAPRLTTDFTNHPQEIENDLVTVQSKGRTSLLDAIYMGLKKLRTARYSRRALLIISDGGDNHSRYTEHDVQAAIKESDVLVYAVGTYDNYVSTVEERLGPELLTSVAEATGGQAFTLSSIQELPEVTRIIGTQLRHQYVLAYTPQSRPHDGRWHKIKVKLRLPNTLHAFLHVDARSGYYAVAE